MRFSDNFSKFIFYNVKNKYTLDIKLEKKYYKSILILQYYITIFKTL